MELCWLTLVRGGILELRPLKDYAGQALVFNTGSFRRRCVTAETNAHALVQRYVDMGMIAREQPAHPPPAAPSVELHDPVPPAAATAVVSEPDAPAPTPVVDEGAVDTGVTEEPVSASEDLELSVSEPSPEAPQAEEEPEKSHVESGKKKRR